MITSSRIYTRSRSPFYQAEIRLDTGEILRRSTGSDTVAGAEAFLSEWRTEIGWRAQLGVKIQSKTVDWCWREYIKSTVIPQKKLKYYTTAYTKYVLPHWGDRTVDGIKATQIELWRDGLDLSISRKCAIEVVLRQILKWAERAGWIDEGRLPRFTSTKQVINRRSAYTPEETKLILDWLLERRGRGCKKTVQDYSFILYYYVALLSASGARPGGELNGLRWKDVSRETLGNRAYLRLLIRPEISKVRRPREVVCDAWVIDPILVELKGWQRDWGRDGPEDYIFGDRRGHIPNFSRRIYLDAIADLNLPLGQRGEARTLYSFRHYKLTEHLRRGAPLHMIAQNSGNSPSMISTYYSHTITPDMVEHLLTD